MYINFSNEDSYCSLVNNLMIFQSETIKEYSWYKENEQPIKTFLAHSFCPDSRNKVYIINITKNKNLNILFLFIFLQMAKKGAAHSKNNL